MPEVSDHHRQLLIDGIEELGLTVSNQQIDLLIDYLGLLQKWNKSYNLTAIRDTKEMVARHLLDSLSIVPYIQGNRLIDVGTGAGLPGVVLAIVFPDKHIDLLDSNGKKTRFLFQVKVALGLENLTIHHCRVESFHPPQLFDGVVSRAFATLADMISGSRHLLDNEGKFYAMKGVFPEQELSEIIKAYNVDACHQLFVPNNDGQRHLVVITQKP